MIITVFQSADRFGDCDEHRRLHFGRNSWRTVVIRPLPVCLFVCFSSLCFCGVDEKRMDSGRIKFCSSGSC
uniref:Uncharacterized protein n=1 Tax=Caenorhabditis tropicalis TaxID=1561998 RepID=A0A1I7TWS8_9PELO